MTDISDKWAFSVVIYSVQGVTSRHRNNDHIITYEVSFKTIRTLDGNRLRRVQITNKMFYNLLQAIMNISNVQLQVNYVQRVYGSLVCSYV